MRGRGVPEPRAPMGDDLVPLDASFFERETSLVARDLLGKMLVTTVGDTVCGGCIVETEAYLGADDPGSHAATKGVTARNRVMYGPPGCAYVYFTYGAHHMLNLVTEPAGVAGAVLIRAIEPLWGVETMERRRGRRGVEVSNGPGKVAGSLGIDLGLNGERLGGAIAVYDAAHVPDEAASTSGRVGLSSGHDLQLRFYVTDSAYVSRGRTGPRRARRGADDDGGTR
ncbi:MAG TPA: DNA-3-methyladenine glycosylase [Actinobacteria bacterium]|nr:DNA-3-methyladenine glycosylase [Actinomycetota bacterium]